MCLTFFKLPADRNLPTISIHRLVPQLGAQLLYTVLFSFKPLFIHCFIGDPLLLPSKYFRNDSLSTRSLRPWIILTWKCKYATRLSWIIPCFSTKNYAPWLPSSALASINFNLMRCQYASPFEDRQLSNRSGLQHRFDTVRGECHSSSIRCILDGSLVALQSVATPAEAFRALRTVSFYP